MSRSDKLSQRKIIDRALGPVWETNHMWLIPMVVIFFTGFPRVYSRVSINLHIPLTAIFIGIIARGTSFTFRHYDAKQGRSQKPYNFFFIFSSVWTPFFLGVVTGTLIPGGIDANPTGYMNGYVWPWLRPFPLALGLFTVFLFAFLAAVYLIGESPTEDIKRQFTRRAIIANIVSVLSGGVVFFFSIPRPHPPPKFVSPFPSRSHVHASRDPNLAHPMDDLKTKQWMGFSLRCWSSSVPGFIGLAHHSVSSFGAYARWAGSNFF